MRLIGLDSAFWDHRGVSVVYFLYGDLITFGTHKFVRRLRDAGTPEAQAEALSETFRDAQGEAELATKQDLRACLKSHRNAHPRHAGEPRIKYGAGAGIQKVDDLAWFMYLDTGFRRCDEPF